MLDLLWLIPALPLAGFALLALAGGRLPRGLIAAVGSGTVGLSAALTLALGAVFLSSLPEGGAFRQALWSWIAEGGFQVDIAFRLDGLSLVMLFVVTFVGFLIHLYSAGYMAGEEGLSRFYAYMNLFVCAMLILVLADNLLLLYLGWEGVGLCSYLLIGFWYRDPANGRAARKAFVVTRIGDTAMAVGIFLLFWELGTLDIQALMESARAEWGPGSNRALLASLLLLGGAVGKSAQLPLQTWLPDAMAGPTPVSALIHAATMVTAGVYLIARTHGLFLLAPEAMTAVAVVGAATLLLSGFTALTQSDIKRVLAYSTISQIGYMFLALGVGAWSAAIFHLMTHAFFKALLFMGAGAVILCLHHEQEIFRMGGLWKKLPVVFWTFLAGAGALAALPVITAGFYSKDLILWRAWSSEQGSPGYWAAGCLGAFITSLYTFRLLFLVFFGKAKTEPTKKPGISMVLPLAVLAILSLVGGFVETPAALGHVQVFSGVVEQALPAVSAAVEDHGLELALQMSAGAAGLLGLLAAYLFFLRKPGWAFAARSKRPFSGLFGFWRSGWGFDDFYDLTVVRPFVGAARLLRRDLFDLLGTGLSMLLSALHLSVSETQGGRLRFYAWGIALGALAAVAVMVFL